MIKGKRILLTGGQGFIGSWLTEKFIDHNELTLFDNGRRNAFQYLPKNVQKNVKIIKGDILDQEMVKKIVKKKDIIIHMAAIAGASFYEKEPLLTINVNLFGTTNLLNSISKSSLDQVIIFSSSETYGPLAKSVTEESLSGIGPVTQGRWSYAMSKLAADHLAFAHYKQYKTPITIVRPFNIYGPRQVGEGAISNMTKNVIVKNKIYVTGKGLQKRSWCYIEDFVDAITLMIEKKAIGECFNIGNEKEYCSIVGLAKQVQRLKPGSKIYFIEKATADVQDRLPVIKKARQMLGFNPKVTLGQGLKLSFDWTLENINNV